VTRAAGPRHPIQRSVRGITDSPTLAINERCEALRARGVTVYRLGLGQSPFPVPTAVVEALRAHADAKAYLPVRGLPALREAVAGFMERRQGLRFDAEDVLIGPGSKELLFLLQVVFDGELLVPTPAWVSYAPQARILGRRVVPVPAAADDEWKLRPDAIDAACRRDSRRRVLILNYPSNPTGGGYTVQELEGLAAVARRHDLIVLSDEIYGELDFTGSHVSFARLYPEATIVSTGLSKWCGAGGWRLGTFVFPEPLRWLLDAMAAVASESFTSTCAPIQYAAVTAFSDHPDIDPYLAAVRRLLQALIVSARDELVAVGARVLVPVGGFYLYPDFTALADQLARRRVRTSQQLAAALLEEERVATLPGESFGRPPEELTLRLAMVDFDGAAALNALGTGTRPVTPGFLAEHCAPVMEAVARLARLIRRTSAAA